ncbi:MAG: alpha/beta hydrolase, partial [Bryobacterales bacterium]|nr:alpha/beta hydrolase [Bryobacterales bacterium]
LSVERASIAGVSLGGWLALDYASRRPERIERIAVLCPGGVGRQKVGIVFATIGLKMCGAWGKRKLLELILGRPRANPTPTVKAFMEFVSLIHKYFRPRMVRLPVFADDALRKLRMPVLAIVGGRDVLLDSAQTKVRLQRNLVHAEVVFLPEARHFIPGQTERVLAFLKGAGSS